MNDERTLTDRVVVVSGAAHGIGHAYARRLARLGAAVVVADLDVEAAEAVARQVAEEHRVPTLGVGVDVSDEQAVAGLAAAVETRFHRVDALVNNAAMFATVPMARVGFEDIGVEEWDRMMAVNVKGVWLMCRALVPLMRSGGYGKIVNVTSDTVFKGTPLRVHYVASKSALLGFTRTLAAELGPAGIRVNAVAPGVVLSEAVLADQAGEDRRAAAVAAQALRQAITPDDVAGTVAFLVGPDSDAVTGQVMVVNAGSVMR